MKVNWETAERLFDLAEFPQAAEAFKHLAAQSEDKVERGTALFRRLESLTMARNVAEGNETLTELESYRNIDRHLDLLIDAEKADLRRLEGRLDEALELLDTLLAVEPQFSTDPKGPFFHCLRRNRGLILAEQNRFAEALPLLLDSEKRIAEPQVLFYLGHCFHGLRDFAAAFAYYDRALRTQFLGELLEPLAERRKSECAALMGR